MKKNKLSVLTVLSAIVLLSGCNSSSSSSISSNSSSINSSDSFSSETNSSSESLVTSEIISSSESSEINGEGTKDNPYLISNKAQLNEFSKSVTLEGKNEAYYKLTSDITYNDEWSPIGSELIPFKGVFDGNGHTINGIKLTNFDKNQNYYGLFAFAQSATIKNLTVTNVEIKMNIFGSNSLYYFGGLVGFGTNISIDNVHFSYKEYNISSLQNNSSQTIIGGLIGYESIEQIDGTTYFVSLKNSSVDGQIILDTRDADDTISAAGGIVGYSTTGAFEGLFSINNCFFNGSVEAGTYAGGISSYIGYFSSIVDSYAHGSSIKTTDTEGAYAGGIVARATYETALIGCVSDFNSITSENSTSSVYKSYAGSIVALSTENDYENNGTGLKGTAIYNSFSSDVILNADEVIASTITSISSSLFKDTLKYASSVWDLSTTLPVHKENPSLGKAIVTFDDNYSSNEKETLEIDAGQYNANIAIKTTEDDLKRTSYSFSGYYYDQEATTEYRFYAPINKDTILYAGWTDLTNLIGNYNYDCEYYGSTVSSGKWKFDEEFFYWISDDNMIFIYKYKLRGNYIFIGECVSEPKGYYDGSIFTLNEDGTINAYDINDESAVYTATKTTETIEIPDYSSNPFLGKWYNSKTCLELLANGNAIAFTYGGSEVEYFGGYRVTDGSMHVNVWGKINNNYIYDEDNDIFIANNDVLTREKSTIYSTSSYEIMLVVCESQTYFIENGKVSNGSVIGTIENGNTISINGVEYTISGTTLTIKTPENPSPEPPENPSDGEETNTLPPFCGTWTGKIGVNSHTFIINSDGTISINGNVSTYVYNDDGTIVVEGSPFSFTYNKDNQSLYVVYDDGDYNAEGTLTDFVAEEPSSDSDTGISDNREMSEKVIGTYEGTWGARSQSECTLQINNDGTGSLSNSNGIVFTFTYEVDENGVFTTANIVPYAMSFSDLRLTYHEDSQTIEGAIFEDDQMFADYTINVTKTK